ncbi:MULTISPECIES: DUF2811 domain-containing protein [Cyanophyceae]|uniref:DUF2811 domain-containing protein n=1 Tax=Cyanophyceae TaxID=3028117 RepID=UPI001F549E25|nr:MULTISPECIES: DUF2811 domain-containing protein [unclassified Phormidium]
MAAYPHGWLQRRFAGLRPVAIATVHLPLQRQRPMTLKMSTPKVSLMAEVPEDLYNALQVYLDGNPAWNQHRVFCAALSLFLMQNSECARDVNRIYLDALFDYTT